MPDYTYYYTIPALDFELIAMDWNWVGVGIHNDLGGDGLDKGASLLTSHCGSKQAVESSLRSIKDASTELLNKRAAQAVHRNVAIIGHYPPLANDNTSFRDMYLSRVPPSKRPT